MKGKIHTVLGEKSPRELGFTQCHEHLLLRRGKSFEINPALCMDDLEKSVREAAAYKAAGGAAVVEAQPVGCGRDSVGLVEISRRTGVDVIASTGFHKLLFYPEGHWIRHASERELAGMFVEELTGGMYSNADRDFGGSRHNARAGIIKTALDIGDLYGRYRELFGAAVLAHKETGAPLMVHIEKGSCPEALTAYLEKNGADLSKIYFCHMDRACGDEEVFRRVLEDGVSLEFDTIGRFRYHSDAHELDLFRKVLDWGYGGRLLFSLDTTRERLKAYTSGAVGLSYILDTFMPYMKKEGISDKDIYKISIENPGRILAW